MIETASVRHSFATVNGLRLHQLQVGSGGRPLVCLHGVTGHAWTWYEVAQALQDHPEEALRVHVQEELGVSLTERPSPWVAAYSSFACFAVGALIPLLPYLFGSPHLWLALATGGVGLALAGAIAARFTGRSGHQRRWSVRRCLTCRPSASRTASRCRSWGSGRGR
jgi:hypothetical protein